jgi:AcrR family transcriptional regulator
MPTHEQDVGERSAVPATPTTPKGRRTRQGILAAARAVFGRDGFVNARMLDVAVEAELSLGAVYRYFTNKENLFAGLLGDIHEELYAASTASRASFAQQPFGALLEANYGYLSHYHANRDVMRTLVEAANVDPSFRDIWWKMRARHTERFVTAAADAHGIVELDGIDAAVAAELAACMVEQAAYVWYAHEDLNRDEIALHTAAEVVTRAWYRLFFPGADGEFTPDEVASFLAELDAPRAAETVAEPG